MRIKLLNKEYVPIVIIIILSLSIRLYALSDLMPFIGDQAWFYLSAHDALVSGRIPLVGITASRTWLHQGAFWTYILMPILRISSHPAWPGYITALLGVLTVVIFYYVLKDMSNKKSGLIGSLLYATSPLVIMTDRMPYHTSLTPLLTIGIVYALWHIIKTSQRYWVILVALLAIMQNINLAGFPVVYCIFLFIVIGRLCRHPWARSIEKNIVLQSCFVWLLFMMPFLIYDMRYGFYQTVRFYIWIIVEPFRALLMHGTTDYVPILRFMGQTIQRLIFFPSLPISIGLFASVLMIALKKIYRTRTTIYDPQTYITVWLVSMLGIVIVGKTPSDAYVYTLFPLVIMLCAFVLGSMNVTLALVATLCIAFFNCISLIKSQYLIGVPGGYGASLSARISGVQAVISDTHGSAYNIRVVGPGSQFSSTGMYFEYIAKWLGHPPSHYPSKKQYEIYEKDGQLRMKNVSLSQ